MPQHEEGDDDRSVQYVTAATSHLRYYAAALRSAREAAPALIPVLVALGDLPTEFVRWAEREVNAGSSRTAKSRNPCMCFIPAHDSASVPSPLPSAPGRHGG